MKEYSSITEFKHLVALKQYRAETKLAYVRCVWRVAEHFNSDPATLSENQLRQYYLFLREELDASPSVIKMAKWALRCFYEESVKVTGWAVFHDLRIVEPKTLPRVLSRSEVHHFLHAVRETRFVLCFRLMYYCGLRVAEASSLEVGDIKGRQNPPCLHIRIAKGGRHRIVPLPMPLLSELRRWWRTHRHPIYIFPAHPYAGRPAALSPPLREATHPMDPAGIQQAFRVARQASGTHPEVTSHTLRHCYATHLVEEGVSLKQICSYLGHSCIETTSIYTHLTSFSENKTQEALTRLYQPMTSKQEAGLA